MKKIIAFVVIMFSASLHASSVSNSSLYNFHFMRDGVVIVYTTVTRDVSGTCASDRPDRFALDATTPGGKVQLSGLLSAHARGKKVSIVGLDNNCSAYAGTETINYFFSD